MRLSLILTTAALVGLSPLAHAQSSLTPQSQTAAPVMPAPREPTNPNENMAPANNGINSGLSEGRAVAPGPMREAAPSPSRK